MIDFINGQIIVEGVNILTLPNEKLEFLANTKVIEARKDFIGTYYYLENEASGMRFATFIGLHKNTVDWVRLSWLDSPIKDWNDVSGKAMMDEYRLLLNFVEKEVGKSSDIKTTRKQTWYFKWGKIEVAYEPRAYQADIFMKI